MTKPEEGCGQEVPAVVCFQPEDAQQGAHKQFDSEPEEYPVPKFEKRNHIKYTQDVHAAAYERESIKPLLDVQPVISHQMHHT